MRLLVGEILDFRSEKYQVLNQRNVRLESKNEALRVLYRNVTGFTFVISFVISWVNQWGRFSPERTVPTGLPKKLQKKLQK